MRTTEITLIILIITLTFLLGWLSNEAWQQLTPKEIPTAPGDHIPEENLQQTNQTITIKINQPFYYTKYSPTKSMLSLLDSGHNGIMIQPNNTTQIKVGDIISYKLNENTTIVHRVKQIRTDEKGIYYIVKGDNNPQADPYRIRPENIQGILVALIY